MKLLIVEDDRRLSQTLVECVAPTFTADQAFDGAEGLYFAEQGVYDLIILDLMLPRMDGYTVLERLREQRNHTPVLILTAKGETADKVRGLRAGADDYLAKPFSMDELASRIEAILRRSLGTYELHAIAFAGMTIDPNTRSVRIDGAPVDLKGKQYDVLEHLAEHAEQLVTKTQLFDKVWGFLSDTSPSVVEVYVSALRKTLKPYGYDRYLKTVRGGGYLLTEHDDE